VKDGSIHPSKFFVNTHKTIRLCNAGGHSKHKPSVFENKMLRKLSLFLEEEKKEVGSKLQNEELCKLYSSPNIFRGIK
jgi:hypothetical protein